METKHDFTQGNILKKLVLFMVPIFGALVLQAMYGAVDLISWAGLELLQESPLYRQEVIWSIWWCLP